jgi:hypothetical protein
MSQGKKYFLPDSQYVRYQDWNGSKMAVFAAYFDDVDKEDQKSRLERVDDRVPNDRMGPFFLDNEPSSGYRICSTFYHGKEGRWIVRDPRGFYATLEPENIRILLEHCDIIDQEVQGDLVWIHSKERLSGHMLVPANDDVDVYREAEEYTNVYKNVESNDRVTLYDVQRGDVVKNSEGVPCHYLGGLWHITSAGSFTDIRRHYFYEPLDEDHKPEKVCHASSFDPYSIVRSSDDPLSEKEASERVNEYIADILERHYEESMEWKNSSSSKQKNMHWPRLYGLPEDVLVCHHEKFEVDDVEYIREEEGNNRYYNFCIDGSEYEVGPVKREHVYQGSSSFLQDRLKMFNYIQSAKKQLT